MADNKYQHYPPLEPVPTGIRGRCPRCGEGNLFSGLLTVKQQCTACHLDYDFNDSGDGPTVFVIMGLGFLILGLALFVEFNYFPPRWVHVLLWPTLTVIMGLPVLRMMKGVLINLTWHHDAASGRLDDSGNN
ncbi:MAG: DUF983 domain-containing protein [Rhizobiaceae bacterium]|nr:DUF983 domain-containing protein [Rhizobiaceae bacterium]